LVENGVWDDAAQRAYVEMLCKDAFACAGNVLRGERSKQKRAFRELHAQTWVAFLFANPKKWPKGPAMRLFLWALVKKKFYLIRWMVAFYRHIQWKAK
jgi:hypothetical protein